MKCGKTHRAQRCTPVKGFNSHTTAIFALLKSTQLDRLKTATRLCASGRSEAAATAGSRKDGSYYALMRRQAAKCWTKCLKPPALATGEAIKRWQLLTVRFEPAAITRPGGQCWAVIDRTIGPMIYGRLMPRDLLQSRVEMRRVFVAAEFAGGINELLRLRYCRSLMIRPR